MPAAERRNKIVDFLILPGFRAWRHALLITAFSFISFGSLLFLSEGGAELSGVRFYLVGAFIAALLVAYCYLNLYLLVPRLMLRGRYLEYLFALLGGIFLYVVIKWAAERYLLSLAGVETEFNAVTVLDWLSSVVMYAICLMSTSAVVLFRQWIADTHKINDLENDCLQSSVDEIKSRVNAPVLYRVLGYAAEKVKTDPEKVSLIIFRLSERLRRELYDK